MWRSVFAVPCDIVDSKLKLCGEVPLKVLLLLLRHNGSLDVEKLSELTGRSEAVVTEALEYLAAEGLVQDGSAEIAPAPALKYEYIETEKPEAPASSAPEERKISTLSGERRRFERDEINSLAENDESVSWLLQESQQVLGKTLGAVATDTIVALYSHYGMQPDVIMMVLQYCKSIGKTGMGYIEKVAASWMENGIETHEQAELEIQRQKQRNSNEIRIKSAFGIEGRGLTSYEKKYIHVWLDDFGFDVPLVTFAFERAVEMTGKLSFAYINGILTSWHTKGIRTPAAAMRDIRDEQAKRAAPAKSAATTASTSYDLGELEKLLNQGTL